MDEEIEEGEEEQVKKKGLPLIPIIAGVVLIVVVIVVLLFLLVFKKPKADTNTPQNPVPVTNIQSGLATRSVGDTTSIKGPVQDLDVFIVNLADPGGSRYLKTTIQVELSGPSKQLSNEFITNTPKIRDVVIGVLTSKTFDEVSTNKGKTALKQEIRDKLNRFLTKGEISNVYFKDFVVQ